ncbi:Nitrogen fixation protein VnfA [bioreactor metagenome]|uniref:Nitrogen fixation protein VnfA n=1 Tax=bioreactor metagenome TaxID=1076179 RepID=A0A645G1P3_9ZZZZ
MQAKLLRALEAKTITRVGSNKPIALDLRIISATNRNLVDEVAAGRFREDLYYRLNVVSIKIPPLRERVDEIGALALRFVNRYNAKYEQDKKLTYDVVRELEKHPWKGNVRELKNVVESMVLVSAHEYLQPTDIPWLRQTVEPEAEETPRTLRQLTEDYERELLTEARKKHGSSRRIAAALGAEQSTIVRKLQKYGI